MSDKTVVYCQNEVCLKQWRVTAPSSREKLSEARCVECGGRLDFEPAVVLNVPEDEPEEVEREGKPKAGSAGWVALRREMDEAERRGRRRTLVIELALLGVFLVSIPLLFIYSKNYVRSFGLEDEATKPTGPPRQVVVQVTPAEASLAVEGETWPKGELTKDEMVAWTVVLFGNEKKAIQVGAAGYETLEMTLYRRTPDVLKIGLTPATHALRVTSKPSGAMVFVNEKAAGRTPALVKLPMTEIGFEVRVEREGYDPGQRILERGALDKLGGSLHFDLAASLASEVESRWKALADRHLGSGVRVLGRWDRGRGDGVDRLYGQDGDVISMRVTSEAIGFTTALGAEPIVVETSRLAWMEMRNGRAVVRTQVGDTFDGVIGGEGIRYEAQTGVPERIRLERVAGIAFRRRGDGDGPVVPTVAVLAVGNDTFVGSEAAGAIQVMTSLGVTAFKAADVWSMRRIEEEELRIEAGDGTSVRGKVVEGTLRVRLLCNGAWVGIDLGQLTAFQTGKSVAGPEWRGKPEWELEDAPPGDPNDGKADRASSNLHRELEDTEEEVERLEKVIEGILDENRSLNSRRKLERARFRAEKDRIIEWNKSRKRKQWEDLPDEADDPVIRGIDDQLARNAVRLRPEQEALVAAKDKVKRLNLGLRKMGGHSSGRGREQ